MAIDTILVERLDPSQTWEGTPSWHVTGIYVDGRTGVFQASTLSAQLAQWFEAARANARPIAVEWTPGPIGDKYIVDIKQEVA